MLSRRGGSAVGLAGARLASWGRARRRGEAKARRRGRELGHEEAAARQCSGSGCGGDLGVGHGGAG